MQKHSMKYDAADDALAAVFWGEGGYFCAGWDLKRASEIADLSAMRAYEFPDEGEPPMAPMGPSRLNSQNRSLQPYQVRLLQVAWSLPCGPTCG